MQTYHKAILTLLLLFCSITVFAQENQAAMTLLKEGTALHDAKKYDEAIAKYDAALKIDANNSTVLYEKAFTLYASGKANDALAILEKLVVTDKSARTYALLGNIYDERKDFDKAISIYKKGVAVAPKDANLWYNLSVSYLIQKNYAQAEAAATEAIKANPRHASSQRVYAMATYNEGKHINSILAWCNFLIMEPQTQRSVEACMYLKHILYFNVKGNSMNMGGTDELSRSQQMSVALSVTGGLAIAKTAAANNGAAITPLDSLSLPLQYIFKLAAEKKDPANSVFFNKYYADFFGTLANTEYMNVFFRYITISVFRNDNIAWLKEHQDNLKGLITWVIATKRETE
ncbi:tetratricopeptide repeat protein [Mucilaginibacter sp. UR6-11]|uniref:tetratricopeptide repeat protein n=1 Tax=Mucilaginibacter sp. UR6-11 TaxID=1435644 RepID=UPI001E593E55|nr:tetratricopeptide repeat protein [Mucilaginibacter sp. UR6-11]MCC8426795.1 tetratricopeptide repeat protein [Mucilaginibacter sp. UR6-11]